MKIDQNEFFRRATMLICGSLDIETAMRRCCAYLGEILPASEMALSLYEEGPGVVRALARVNREGIVKPSPLIPVPNEIIEQVDREMAMHGNVRIINRPEEDPVSSLWARSTGETEVSHMVLRLMIEENRLGAMVISSEGNNRYTRAHARLLALLHDPFAIALSNVLRYQEVLKLKEMLDSDNQYLHQELRYLSGDEIIGAGFGLKGVMAMVRQVAPLVSPVLLLGETGVGKEVIANAIHYSSPRKSRPFIKVNCGAIPDNLLDSELFGHEKGAFTGAVARKRGRFERAHTGTIFLDEIGELTLPAQIRLLRVIQEKEIERVGGSEAVPMDVRIISATHRNLEEMIRAGRFREDLWFRLNIFPITIPPLRRRKEDIPSLVHHFVERKARDLKFHTPPEISPAGMDRLKDYPWPGNVRELENLVERSLIQTRGQDGAALLRFDPLLFPRGGSAPPTPPDPGLQFPTLDEAMARHIQRALKRTHGKIEGPGGAARLLEINPNTLRSRMKKLGISHGRLRSQAGATRARGFESQGGGTNK